jgi:hypothetical protein
MTKQFYKNTVTGTVWEWTPQLAEYASHNAHLILCNEDGIEVAEKNTKIRSYKEMAQEPAAKKHEKKGQLTLTDDEP